MTTTTATNWPPEFEQLRRDLIAAVVATRQPVKCHKCETKVTAPDFVQGRCRQCHNRLTCERN